MPAMPLRGARDWFSVAYLWPGGETLSADIKAVMEAIRSKGAEG